jgi:translation elongation factor aEF-1 beta
LAKIVASIKVFPSDVTVDLGKLRDDVKRKLPPDAAVQMFEEEPIAFGLVALIAHITMPEKDGKMEEVERALKSIKNVSEIEVIMLRRI